MGKYPPFGILDSDSECVFNKKLKMRPVKKSCSAQNLHHLQTLSAQPDTREEKEGYKCTFLAIPCGWGKQNQRNCYQHKEPMVKILHFSSGSLSLPSSGTGKVLLCQLWVQMRGLNMRDSSVWRWSSASKKDSRHFTRPGLWSSAAATWTGYLALTLLTGFLPLHFWWEGEKPRYLSICMIFASYLHCWHRKVLGVGSVHPLWKHLPQEVELYLSNCTKTFSVAQGACIKAQL